MDVSLLCDELPAPPTSCLPCDFAELLGQRLRRNLNKKGVAGADTTWGGCPLPSLKLYLLSDHINPATVTEFKRSKCLRQKRSEV